MFIYSIYNINIKYFVNNICIIIIYIIMMCSVICFCYSVEVVKYNQTRVTNNNNIGICIIYYIIKYKK